MNLHIVENYNHSENIFKIYVNYIHIIKYKSFIASLK